MENPHSLNAIERTCLVTSACRCEAVRQAAADSPLCALDTSFDEQIIARLHNQPPSTLIPKEDLIQGAPFVAARGIELDQLLLDAPCTQIVLLGVGMDPRPWRVPWPQGAAVTVFELDSAAVLELRRRAVELFPAPVCHRQPVVADLSDWDGTLGALLRSGLQLDKPVVWLAEGLLGYLTEAKMAALFKGTRLASPPGSAFIASCPPSPEYRRPWMTSATVEESSHTLSRAQDAGWAVREVLSNAVLTQKHNIPFMTPLMVLSC